VKLNEAESLQIFCAALEVQEGCSRRRVIIRRLMDSGMAVTCENSELGWENGPPESKSARPDLWPASACGCAMALVGKGCYFGDHPSVGFRRHRASPDHVRVIGPVKIAHARLNVSFQQYHGTSSFCKTC
jgi:hypothetical protein